jgi:GNAT superfamily N-acetyltransferase
MEIKTLEFGSEDYDQMLELRIVTLLEPIGVPASYADPEKERDDIFIGAFEDEKIIACCVLTRIDSETVQLRQMAVREDLQGKGIGAAIIEFAESIAREQNYASLVMHARDPVLDFYKKCGYSIDGEQFFEVGMGHHKMRKDLL